MSAGQYFLVKRLTRVTLADGLRGEEEVTLGKVADSGSHFEVCVKDEGNWGDGR